MQTRSKHLRVVWLAGVVVAMKSEAKSDPAQNGGPAETSGDLGGGTEGPSVS
jgi:hypothetical protein